MLGGGGVGKNTVSQRSGKKPGIDSFVFGVVGSSIIFPVGYRRIAKPATSKVKEFF
jgi:hypothetical protein